MRRLTINALRHGFSLIELMVALAIGAFLVMGLIEVFSSTKAAFQTQDALSRVQENARFALEFLRRDARMVGHMGCISEVSHFLSSPPSFTTHLAAPAAAVTTPAFPFRFDMPIQGYEANGTSPDYNDATVEYTITAARLVPTTNLAQWTPAIPAASTLGGKALPGSDVLVLRFFGETLVPLATPFVNNAAEEVTVDTTQLPAGFIENGGMYGLGDCDHASVFQATTALAGAKFGAASETGTAANGDNARAWTEDQYGNGSTLHRAESTIYYVGQGAGDATQTRPALMRLRLVANTAAGTSSYQPEELVQGVENMQILYGVDTTAPRDDAVDTYLRADQVNTANQWPLVISVRISLLLRSPDQANGSNGLPQVAGNVTIQPELDGGGNPDGRVRVVYETDVAIRNRIRGV